MNKRIADYIHFLRESGRTRNIPNISEKMGTFLVSVCNFCQPKHLLEIGPANGVSTIYLSEYVGLGGRLITIESSRHAFEECRLNLANYEEVKMDSSEYRMAHVDNKYSSGDLKHTYKNVPVELLFGYAQSYMDTWIQEGVQKYDIIYVDGTFKQTVEFLERSEKLLQTNGLIVVDDAIKYRWKMEGLEEWLENTPLYHVTYQIDEDDGALMIGSKEVLHVFKKGCNLPIWHGAGD